MKPPSRKEILDELGRFQKESALTIGLDAIVDTLADESDRGMVVIVGSLTEDILLECILKRLPGANHAVKKNLTRSGGLLSTWADRTNLALAMGLIDEEDADHLEVLKTMRNACAHSRRHIDFCTPELRAALSLMYDGDAPEAIRVIENDIFLRTLFFLGASYIWGRLRGETKEQSGDRIKVMFREFRNDAIEQAALLQKQKPQDPQADDGAPSPPAQ